MSEVNELSERDQDIAYFGERIANRHFYGTGPKIPPRCYSGEAPHDWVLIAPYVSVCGPCGLGELNRPAVEEQF